MFAGNPAGYGTTLVGTLVPRPAKPNDGVKILWRYGDFTYVGTVDHYGFIMKDEAILEKLIIL